MATILRYVKYLRHVQGISRRINYLSTHIETCSGKLKLQNIQVPYITKSYATRATGQNRRGMNNSENSFRNLENHLHKAGRVVKFEIERVLEEIQITGSIPTLEALTLLRSCGRPLMENNSSQNIELVQEIWDTLERLKVPLDVSHYNALLNVYLEKKYTFSVDEFKENMEKKGIIPNRVTYQRLIEAYCQQGDIAGATKILGIMSQEQLPICENIFNSLITGHSEANDMESAIGILKTMENAKISPTADTYSALLCAYAKRGDMKSINETLKKIPASDIILMTHHYVDIIISMIDNGHYSQAREFIGELSHELKSDTEVGRLLLKLVDIHQIDFALDVLKNTASEPLRHRIRSGFLIRSVSCNENCTVEEIINACKTLEDEKLHGRAFSIALFHVLSNKQNPERGLALMKAWSSRGGEIRDHFFWPLLRSHSNAANAEGIIDIIKTMKNDYGIIPSLDTLRDYVIPYMIGQYEDIINTLEGLNIPREDIELAIACRLVLEKKMRNAAMFMILHNIKYPKDLFLRLMGDALNVRDDTKSFVFMTRFLSDENSEKNFDNPSIDIIDAAVREALSAIPKYKVDLVEKLLEDLVESGLSVSSEVGNEIKKFLTGKMSAEAQKLIEQLTSGNLTPVSLDKCKHTFKIPLTNNGNEDALTNRLRTDFAYHFEQKNEQEAYRVLKEMEEQNYASAPVYAQAIKLFCITENLELATEYLKKFQEKYPNGVLDFQKILYYAELLVKKDRFNDALKFLSEQPKPQGDERKSQGVVLLTRKLLEACVETRHVENTIQLFNFLKANNYIEIDNYALGPLVKIHVVRNDLPKALEEFERACLDYKCAPYKNMLTMAFINAEDADSLQKLTDLCTDIHGENNSLVDLALLFLECDRPKQAKKILETPGLRVLHDKITNSIERFAKQKRYDLLDEITKITRGITRLDKGVVYNSLINIYDGLNDYQKGLALWTEMQEYDITPTKHFLLVLNQLLKRNHQEVPFVYDHNQINKPTEKSKQSSKETRKSRSEPHKYDEVLADSILNKDWTTAESLCRSPSTIGRQNGKYSSLLAALLDEGEFDRALENAKIAIKNDIDFRPSLFLTICDKLIDSGREQEIENIHSIMSEKMIEIFDFQKILSKILIKKKGVKNFIEGHVIESDANRPREAESFIHFGEITHGLIQDPSLLPEFEKWAKNLADNGIIRGMQSLWNFHFLNKSPNAEQLWNEFMDTSKSPLIRPVTDTAEEKKDPELLLRLMDKISSSSNIGHNTKCKVYIALINTYTSMEKYDEALEVFHQVSEKFTKRVIPRRTIQALKKGLEKTGRSFPDTNEPQERLKSAATL